MNKKWLIIGGVILVVLALGVAAYFAWQNRERIVEVIPEIIEGGITPLEPKVERLTMVSSKNVETYWIEKGTSLVRYLGMDGAVMEIDAQGVETASELDLKSPISVIPSPEGEWLFVKSNLDGESAVYKTEDNAREADFIGIGPVAWGREDGKIAMIRMGNDSGSVLPRITTQDIGDEKTPPAVITALDLTGFDLQWPQKDAIYLTQRPSADYISEMWRVDVKTKKLVKFLSGRGLMVQWSPMGDRALKFTTTEGRAHRLSIIDSAGVELMALRFITMPDKCAVVTPTQMYCAIPRDQEALARITLPDEYLKKEVYFQDGIYQIDLTTNGIRAIFEDEDPKIDATKLTVLEDRILFINRYDKKLYSLKLQ